MKWLGVWIDRERKFEKHVKIKMKEERKIAGVIRRLRKGTKGIGVGNAMKRYIACGRATMDYGSRI